MAKIQQIENLENLNKILNEARTNLVVVHFSAKWSEQCQQMNEVMLELAKTPHLVNVRFVEIEAEELPEVTMKFNVSAVPVFVFFKSQVEIDRLEGVNPAQLSQKVNHLVSLTTVPPPSKPKESVEEDKEELNSRLKSLINSSPVMLFMKGSPDQPKCGFSRTIIGILNELNVDYSHFNILEDETVRQGLKTYSNWPTYPQLYKKGEFLGGLDIVQQLFDSGELKSMLPTKEDLNSKLKSLINKGRVVIFMKGSAEQPRCGFSKTAIAILKETGVTFETFDILSDEEVRQGLKSYSNWPTYPQLYVNGEFIGGLDILKELQEAGELMDILKEEK